MEEFAKSTVQEFNLLLDRIRTLLASYLKEPAPFRRKIVEAWKASLIKPIPTTTTHSSQWGGVDALEMELERTKEYTNKEIDEELERVESIFEPIHEFFKTICKLYLIMLDTDLYSEVSEGGQDNSYGLQEVVMGFMKGGSPYFISVNELKSHGIYVPTH